MHILGPWFCPNGGVQSSGSSSSSSVLRSSRDGQPYAVEDDPSSSNLPRFCCDGCPGALEEVPVSVAAVREHPLPLVSFVQGSRGIYPKNGINIDVLCHTSSDQFERWPFMNICCTELVEYLLMEMSLRLSTQQVIMESSDLMFVSVTGTPMSAKVTWEDYNMQPGLEQTVFCVQLWQKAEWWAMGKGDRLEEKKLEEAAQDWMRSKSAMPEWLKRSGQQRHRGEALAGISEEPQPDQDKECKQS